MWVHLLVFSLLGTSLLNANMVTVDLCADEWALQEKPADILALSNLSRHIKLSLYRKNAIQFPHHGNTLEELLALKPTIIAAEYPLPFIKRKKLAQQGVKFHILPPLNQWEDIFNRFPKMKNFSIPSIGKNRKILVTSHQLHSPGIGTFWHDFVTKLGYYHIAHDINLKGWGYVPVELILKLKPDFIIQLGENVKMPNILRHLPKVIIPKKLYLCPSPKGIISIINKLEIA